MSMSSAVPPAQPQSHWTKDLSRYQWFVLIVATMGWLFDTMDQQFFNLARKPAITELLKAAPSDPMVDRFSGISTSVFMVGWAIGGLIFGVLGDRLGRARTLVITIFTYSLCTGLSALSVGVWDFMAYRFLTGLGVGGAFAAGATLIAETMSDRTRPHALATFQAFSAVGNMIAAFTTVYLGFMGIGTPWRVMFLIGALPAFLAVFIMRKLQEPPRWLALRDARLANKGTPGASNMGSIPDLFRHPRWRTNTIAGLLLAFAGVVGVWGIGFFSFDLARSVFRPQFLEYATNTLNLTGDAAAKYAGDRLTMWTGIISLVQNLGAFFGIYAFAIVSARIGRRGAFGIFLILAMISTMAMYYFLTELWQIFVLPPLMGFCQLALFGGYAIYFPELFPTRLRSTGISFCYNVGRLIAAIGPLTLGFLASAVYKPAFVGDPSPFRYAGMTMCACFLIGLIALPFAPETLGKPLPEEEGEEKWDQSGPVAGLAH